MKNIFTLSATLFLALNSQAQDFTPDDYNPALWLDASDSGTIVHNGGAISTWQDKSGNGNHTNQATAANQPTFTNTTNGILFDGDDLLIGNNLGYGADDQFTLFVVAAPAAGSSKGSTIAKGQWTSSSDYRIELGENGYDICVQNEREWNSSGSSWNIAHKNLVHTYFDENNQIGFYLNGARHELPATANGAYSPNSDNFSIGARFIESNFFSGNIFEVIYFQQKLTRCEILQIEGYLYHKWNMQSYIIATHPYKNNSFGLCSDLQTEVDENSANGTLIDNLKGTYINAPVTFSDWRIEDEGMYAGTFALNTTGELSVLDNTHLDHEKVSAFNIEVSAMASGVRVYGNVVVNLNDLEDGGTPKTHSELWGVNGEKWNPRGRLPDFSYVGYKSSEGNYTYPTTIVDVTEAPFNAIPNDDLSDVAAIKAAINSTDSGIIYFPPGKYIIDDFITIEKNNIVLRGAGNDSTTGTHFYYPLNAVELGSDASGANTGGSGNMITFKGRNAGPSINIIEDTKMGDRSITLSSVTGLSVGDFVGIEYSGSHPAEGELWDHLYNNQNFDWACSISWSTGNDGLEMFHTVERIEGNIVTLKEPIRLDIKRSWNGVLRQRGDYWLQNCGVENIFMEHKYIDQSAHGSAPGYNSIQFSRVYNSWVNNVSIKNADNGIRFSVSAFSEAKNITFLGREGHHGCSFGYSSHCLMDNLNFENTNAWIHSFTLTHKASGNVVSNLSGVSGNPISTDFHRNTPWETLITNVDNDWNYNSSGVWCAGPSAGKRTVYWNMGGAGFTSFPSWDDYQTTLIGNLQIPEKFHAEKGWHENVPNIEPSNLHQAQLNRRLTLPADPLFTSDTSLGQRTNYWERDPSRWRVKDGAYQLFFSETPILTGNRLGEYAIYNTATTGNMIITSNIASLENTIINPSANAALIVNYQDDSNYYYALFSANSAESGIYKVDDGVSSLLRSLTLVLANNYSVFSFENKEGVLGVYENGALVGSISDNTFTDGRVGFGSLNDACSFDEISFELSPLNMYKIPFLTHNIKLYPNPTNNYLYLEGDKKELSRIKLYDLLGRDLTLSVAISIVDIDKLRLDLSHLKHGLYILETKTIASKIYKK